VCSAETFEVFERASCLKVVLHLGLCNVHDRGNVPSEQPMAMEEEVNMSEKIRRIV